MELKMQKTIILASIALAMVTTHLVGAEITPEEAVNLLTREVGGLGSETVLSLLHRIDRGLKQYDESEEKFKSLLELVDKRIGASPQTLINIGKVSLEQCQSFEHFENLEALIAKHSFALKSYLQKAFNELDKLCSDTFEQRFRATLDELDSDTKLEALELASHMSKGDEVHADPYEDAEEHLFGGTVNVVERYLEKKGGNIEESSQKLFDTCHQIVDKFYGFCWILIYSKIRRKLNLSDEEKRFLSAVKMCPYMPYNHFEKDIEATVEALDTPKMDEAWARGGYNAALKVLRGFANNLAKFSLDYVDLYKPLTTSERDVDQALQSYLEQTFNELDPLSTEARKRKGSEKEKKKQHITVVVKELEHHCMRLGVYFGPYLYLIERLKIRSEGKSSAELKATVREPLALTKVCRAVFNSPKSELSSEQLRRLGDSWLNAEDGAAAANSGLKTRIAKFFKRN